MELIVNGEVKTIPETKPNVITILTLLKVEMPDMVSVQLNGNFVERNTFETTIVKDKDEIDFMYFMGGGQ